MSIAWLSFGESELPTSAEWLAPAEAERARSMRFAKRRSDFLLARWTAKHAIARTLGIDRSGPGLSSIEVRHATGAERGAPLAFVDDQPAPLEIALTDRAGWAVCAIGAPGARIGCDLELCEPRSDAFVADFLTESERACVDAADGDEGRHRRANLIWSAKESALKVLRTGLRRDTRSVEVCLEGSTRESQWLPLAVRSAEGGLFRGWWRDFAPFLLTVVTERGLPEPVALVEPPALVGAEPTHTWLAAPLAPPNLGAGPASAASVSRPSSSLPSVGGRPSLPSLRP